MYDEDVIRKLKNIPNNLDATLESINREIGYGSRIVRESRDDSGVYTIIKEYGNENILMKVSILSDLDEGGNYGTQTIQYYRKNGIVDYTEVFNLIYDEDAKIIAIQKRGESNE